MATGSMPDITQLNSGAIGTNLIFGDNRKRSIEVIEDDWTSPNTEMTNGRTPQLLQQQQQQGATEQKREVKRMKGQ